MVVTDGFTGNVVLKTVEGTARAVAGAVSATPRGRACAPGRAACSCGRPSASLRERLDPDTTGGAILLGLRGVAVVGHGSSGPRGIANQIALAARAVRERAVERTEELPRALGGRARRAPGELGSAAES